MCRAFAGVSLSDVVSSDAFECAGFLECRVDFAGFAKCLIMVARGALVIRSSGQQLAEVDQYVGLAELVA